MLVLAQRVAYLVTHFVIVLEIHHHRALILYVQYMYVLTIPPKMRTDLFAQDLTKCTSIDVM